MYNVPVMANKNDKSPFAFAITMAQLKWVALALSTDQHRFVLTKAALVHMDGASWLCATDTHRIHAHRVGNSTEHESHIIDLKRVIAEMAYLRAKSLWFNMPDHADAPAASAKDDARSDLEHLFTPLYFDNPMQPAIPAKSVFGPTGMETRPGQPERRLYIYPNVARVIPKQNKTGLAGPVCLNSKYLKEAMAAANQTLGVLVSGWSNATAVRIDPNSDSPQWLAVIMPTSSHAVFESWKVEQDK